ncbi:hydroxymethylbilane synthase [Corynebacterium uberis]|uniref:hydroxymethylbilane synthase n=1 Tax=Corynebacterium TaxID=1716 RepID=UPI001D0ACADD|nr:MULTISPECIES: hydroxymethylbilane synthase [Corynebacterium]MCZ9309520.1 hydroxymethylbilane synthase [Corynebacterium sp. c6VSa_13]UDL73066.1 hydroxymethylbilane synthase [Corynebacterium uberis]UDL76057.1 hydroxymethylbilane synthase [Corynebacterium uberis]UDL78269.1 hydroxymethylbilane synthase [Corynebacterium uberis]UDL80552.1 hydroxymethylbilane synthase [Corynebacterium uberis]
MNDSLTIGTRASLLATTQSGHVCDALAGHGYHAQLHHVTTEGDVNMAPVERIGVGVFTQALREALDRGECDIAVHSFKDLPTAPDPRFHLIVPPREDPREALVARDGLTLKDLPEGATVGTSAPRRVSQLRAVRPDLSVRPLRGNIDTRMGRVFSGELDAIVLAYAGMSRVGRQDHATEVFDPTVLMPAPAQGALAVECRADDARAVAAIDALACPDATDAARAERALLAALEAGCTAPVAAHATLDGDHLTLTAGVFALDGSARLVSQITGARSNAAELGQSLAGELLGGGARDLMATADAP